MSDEFGNFDQNNPRFQKSVYESIEVIVDYVNLVRERDDALDGMADLLHSLTGLDRVGATDPDIARNAKSAACRWLMDNGYITSPVKSS